MARCCRMFQKPRLKLHRFHLHRCAGNAWRPHMAAGQQRDAQGLGLAERELAFEDLLRSAARIIPLLKTMKEKVDQLRNWARDRAAPAPVR